jgi:hypothetical protein
MKVRAHARQLAVRARLANRVEWAIIRHYKRYPHATNIREMLAAVRAIRASGFPVTMSLKINGQTIR